MMSHEREGVKAKLSQNQLLMLAMTLHNIPEGLAVGVAFACAQHDIIPALILSIGIGIQNFPEGTAISLPMHQYGKSKFVTASMLLGILSAVLLTVSLFVPAIDLSAYHAQVQIRYSIMKICENVGLISDMWRGIPIGILIAAVGMLVLSFVRIPPLKAIPCMIVVCMIIIALVDMGNVTAWISKMLARFISSQVSSGSSVSGATIWKSFQAGIYLLAAGLVSGIASCFVSNHQA